MSEETGVLTGDAGFCQEIQVLFVMFSLSVVENQSEDVFFGVLNYRQTVVAKHFIRDIRPIVACRDIVRRKAATSGDISAVQSDGQFLLMLLQRAFTIMANKVNLLFRC